MSEMITKLKGHIVLFHSCTSAACIPKVPTLILLALTWYGKNNQPDRPFSINYTYFISGGQLIKLSISQGIPRCILRSQIICQVTFKSSNSAKREKKQSVQSIWRDKYNVTTYNMEVYTYQYYQMSI